MDDEIVAKLRELALAYETATDALLGSVRLHLARDGSPLRSGSTAGTYEHTLGDGMKAIHDNADAIQDFVVGLLRQGRLPPKPAGPLSNARGRRLGQSTDTEGSES